MSQCCVNCKHWQGTKHSKWGDCQHICVELMPHLHAMVNLFGWTFTVPFDPHDVKYFEDINNHFLKAGEYGLPKGVRKLTRKEQDIRFITHPQSGEIVGERTAPIKVVYFQTKRNREGCGYYG